MSLVQFQVMVVVAEHSPSGAYQQIQFPCILAMGFTFKLLTLAQFSACCISASLLLLFTAGTKMYESSANLSISLPGVMAFRSAALTTYEAGPISYWNR